MISLKDGNWFEVSYNTNDNNKVPIDKTTNITCSSTLGVTLVLVSLKDGELFEVTTTS